MLPARVAPGFSTLTAKLRKSGMSNGLRTKPPFAIGFALIRRGPLGARAFNSGMSRPSLIEKLFGFIAAHPGFQYLQVTRVVGDVLERDLVRPPETFQVMPIHLPRGRPTFGLRRTIMGQRGRTAFPVRRASSWILRISEHTMFQGSSHCLVHTALRHSLRQNKVCTRSRRTGPPAPRG